MPGSARLRLDGKLFLAPYFNKRNAVWQREKKVLKVLAPVAAVGLGAYGLEKLLTKKEKITEVVSTVCWTTRQIPTPTCATLTNVTENPKINNAIAKNSSTAILNWSRRLKITCVKPGVKVDITPLRTPVRHRLGVPSDLAAVTAKAKTTTTNRWPASWPVTYSNMP